MNINDLFLSTIIALLRSNTPLHNDLFPSSLPSISSDDYRIYAADINLPQDIENVFPRIMVEIMDVRLSTEYQQPGLYMHDIVFSTHVYIQDEEGGDKVLGNLEGDLRNAIDGQFINGVHFIGGFAVEAPGYVKERDQETSLWHSEIRFLLQSAYIQ